LARGTLLGPGYAGGAQLRSGILIGYWDEAELARARAALDEAPGPTPAWSRKVP